MFEKLKDTISSKLSETTWVSEYRSFFIRIGFIILTSYILASAINAALLPKMTKIFSSMRAAPKFQEAPQSFTPKTVPNYHEIKKAVLDRNVFNQTGELPKEEDENIEKAKGAFDIEAPCEKTSLKIKLVGMIALEGERRSIATIKEEGFETADVYSEGDYIIGADAAQIVLIQHNQVIINNGGRKECLDLKLGGDRSDSFVKRSSSSFANPPSEETLSVDLDSKFVQSELGEGFGKIIQSARLVPNTVSNQVNGFKVFGIQAGSVLDKAGFKENDVITKVNDTVMEAEQGFALYQALNDERQIRVNILRNGSIPKTIIIRVK